jgi:hypothetical protein
MAKGMKTGGRTKGTPNKVTRSVKEALELAFEQAGGVDGLVDWARSNPTEFYKIWAKLLPRDLNITEQEGNFPQVVLYLPEKDSIP